MYTAPTCIHCKAQFKLNINVFTPAGMRETKISGFCEQCWDTLFTEPNEEEDDE